MVTARIPCYSYRELETPGHKFPPGPCSYQLGSPHAIGFDDEGEPSGGADTPYSDGMALRID